MTNETMTMTAESARYVARRTPRTDGDRRLVDDALRCLARTEWCVRGVELEIQRTLDARERTLVELEMEFAGRD